MVGDAVLLSPRAAGDPCTVRTVTANTAATADTWQVLTFASSGSHNAATFTTVPTYPELAGVTLLGQLRWNRYRLLDGNLVLERPLDGTSAVLARNVVAVRAQYGVSGVAAGSTTLDLLGDAGGDFETLDAASIARVRAVRVGVVTRSPQREKPNATGQCEASLPSRSCSARRSIPPRPTGNAGATAPRWW
jgi:type IV pilus assembly protein PilW